MPWRLGRAPPNGRAPQKNLTEDTDSKRYSADESAPDDDTDAPDSPIYAESNSEYGSEERLDVLATREDPSKREGPLQILKNDNNETYTRSDNSTASDNDDTTNDTDWQTDETSSTDASGHAFMMRIHDPGGDE